MEEKYQKTGKEGIKTLLTGIGVYLIVHANNAIGTEYNLVGIIGGFILGLFFIHLGINYFS